jgi:hypothetical protein
MAAFEFESGVQGAEKLGEKAGPWGALAGFALGGIAGGAQARHADRMFKQASQMITQGQQAYDALDVYSQPSADLYGRTVAGVGRANIGADPLVGQMVTEEMEAFGRKKRAAGKSLSGEFIKEGMDQYLSVFGQAKEAIYGAGVTGARMGAQIAGAQMGGAARMTAATLGVTTGRRQPPDPSGALISMAGEYAAGAVKRRRDERDPDYALAQAKSNAVFNPYYGGGMGGMT